ncbi:hypothetical protein KGM_206072 [Danaus plexippus plexippus]|uniref:Uncharacterized protein n=1 Tax=Danaus plexippus plexippus TaxID=278856 RepID=A0A212EU74_DANPL|nr:hypothetical protein KGM_206072 [Danaus plexippus plexippus]
MNQDKDEYEEEYVDVRSLPLRPPQPLVQPEKAVRRPWHPVMYNHTTSAIATKDQDENDENDNSRLGSKEFPHSQRIRNLKRLIAEGKVKPEAETLIFFLCNKFAISEERQARIKY